MDRFGTALDSLAGAAKKSNAVLVSFSAGKDSIAVLDLCARTFQHVEAFFLYIVPGLQCVEEFLDAARRAYGVTIRQYPHWLLREYLLGGTYCPNHYSIDDLPKWKLKDIYGLARADSGIDLIATGAKKADSLWRRRSMSRGRGFDDILTPLAQWTKLDVLAYLRVRGLPYPEDQELGATANGVSLSRAALLHLATKWPTDFQKICEVFPYAEAIVWQQRWYGDG